MTAKGDGLAIFVTAVWISAIAEIEFHQGKMARTDLDTAQLDFDGLEDRHRLLKSAVPGLNGRALAGLVQPHRRYP